MMMKLSVKVYHSHNQKDMMRLKKSQLKRIAK